MENYIAESIRNRQIVEDWERVNPGRTAKVATTPYTVHSSTVPDDLNDAECAAADEICDYKVEDDGWEVAEIREWIWGVILASVLCGAAYYFLFTELMK